MKSLFLRLLYFIIIFFLLFDVNFKQIPGFTTSRIIFFSLSVFTVVHWWRTGGRFSRIFLETNLWFLLSLVVVTSVSFLQYLFSNDTTQLARLTYFTMYGILAPLMLEKTKLRENEFLLFVALSVLLQAFLTLGSYFSPNIKELFSSLILYNANFGPENNLRALGFVSVAGATFSVIQFTGIVSFLLLIRKNEFNTYKRLLIWTAISIILVSILFIGRTGLFLSLISIISYLIFGKLSCIRFVSLSLLFVVFSNFDFISFLGSITSNIEGYDIEYFLAWIRSGFRLNNDLVQGLNEMPIPPLSIETILGTGLVMGPSGIGNASGHDSGYIQSYYSLGLILAIFFYLSYYLFLIRQAKKHVDLLGLLLVFILILIEFKEFFVFSYSYPFFLFSYLLVGQNRNHQLIK